MIKKMIMMNEFAGDEPVTPEQYKQLQSEVAIAARRVMIGRKVIPTIGPFGLGKQTYTYDTMSELSVADLSFKFVESTKDVPHLARSNVAIPILHKEFELDRRDLASSRTTGTPLDTSSADSAAYRVAYLEDALILDGWSADGTTYDISGLYQSANNDYSTTKGFNTAGNALAAVGGAIALMLADNIHPPYNLILNPTQYAELLQSVYTGGVKEFQMVQEILRGGTAVGTGGDIYVSAAQTAATGMMLPAVPNKGWFKYVVAQDVTTEMEILQKSKNAWGRVWVAGVPVVHETNAICKLSDI